MPVGNGGRFTRDLRVRPRDAIRASRRSPASRHSPVVGILPRDQAAPALGRGPAAVPPHARYLQAQRRRGRGAGGRRQRGVLPARRRPLARLGRARRPGHNPTTTTIARASGAEEGHARFYEYLCLRIPLEVDMVVVSR